MTVKQAKKLWLEGEASRFEFSVSAAEVVGKRDGGTKLLAEAINRKEDTVERYALVGRFWNEAIQRYPSDSETLREELPFSYWRAVSVVYKDYGFNDAFDWLKTARDEKPVLEDFRSILPKKPADPQKVLESNCGSLRERVMMRTTRLWL